MTKTEALQKIDSIAKESLNPEQKQLAKNIISKAEPADVAKWYQFITAQIKLGFVFDAAPEQKQDSVAILKENKKLKINNKTNNKINYLIIGENFEALQNLLLVYKGKVDIIYIDPPYNTERSKDEGNDYKQNISSEKFFYRDKFGQTGWLNMINERLKMAKQLLSDDGVIFISIDDSEYAYLKVLCDEIFGVPNFSNTIIWQRHTGGGWRKALSQDMITF